jgi:hypothetical protein
VKPASLPLRWFSIVAVTLYLLAVAVWLLLLGKLDRGIVWRAFTSLFRRRYRGRLDIVRPEQGRCFVAELPKGLRTDADLGSKLVLLENGVPLPLAHSAHADIRSLGGGRYSHWHESLYFATSDGSDPRSNGRVYTVEER